MLEKCFHGKIGQGLLTKCSEHHWGWKFFKNYIAVINALSDLYNRFPKQALLHRGYVVNSNMYTCCILLGIWPCHFGFSNEIFFP